MLIDFSVSGYKVFDSKIEFTMIGDKKFKNKNCVFNCKEFEILKSAIIYGPNNTGKSTFIDSIFLLKQIIEKEIVDKKILEDKSIHNFWLNENIIDYNIKFIHDNILFNYYSTMSFLCKRI